VNSGDSSHATRSAARTGAECNEYAYAAPPYPGEHVGQQMLTRRSPSIGGYEDAPLVAIVKARSAGTWANRGSKHSHPLPCTVAHLRFAQGEGSAMYMRVTRSHMDPTRVDEASQVVKDIAAGVRRRPGFQSIMFGGDRATGQAIAVSTWDTEEHARWVPEITGDIRSRLQAVGLQIDRPSSSR
jgi:hypothetical protein